MHLRNVWYHFVSDEKLIRISLELVEKFNDMASLSKECICRYIDDYLDLFTATMLRAKLRGYKEELNDIREERDNLAELKSALKKLDELV